MCRAFTAGECNIADEMVFNHPITYSEFLDAVDVYPYLTDLTEKEMDRILTLMLDKIANHNRQMQFLVAIAQVPWANLEVDEIVCVNDDFDAFVNGSHSIMHYSGLSEYNNFNVFQNGKSSATVTSGVSSYKYALPKLAYEKLILPK